jgi:glutamate dehydrogenase
MVEAGVPTDVARRYAYRRQLVHAPDAIALANRFDWPVSDVAEVMFGAGQEVGLDRLEHIAAGFNFVDSWQRWALESLEDDMVGIRHQLTEAIIEKTVDSTPAEAIALYLEEKALEIHRLETFINALGLEQPRDLSPLMIGVRQLRSLIG